MSIQLFQTCFVPAHPLLLLIEGMNGVLSGSCYGTTPWFHSPQINIHFASDNKWPITSCFYKASIGSYLQHRKGLTYWLSFVSSTHILTSALFTFCLFWNKNHGGTELSWVIYFRIHTLSFSFLKLSFNYLVQWHWCNLSPSIHCIRNIILCKLISYSPSLHLALKTASKDDGF